MADTSGTATTLPSPGGSQQEPLASREIELIFFFADDVDETLIPQGRTAPRLPTAASLGLPHDLFSMAQISVKLYGEPFDLPFRNHAELIELLEMLYVFDGWDEIDNLTVQVANRLYAAVYDMIIQRNPDQTVVTQREFLDELGRFSRVAAAVLEGILNLPIPSASLKIEKTLSSFEKPFVLRSDPSEQAQISLPPISFQFLKYILVVYAKICVVVLEAISKARDVLIGRIHRALQAVERTAVSILKAELLSSEKEIYREVLRYLGYADERSARSVLLAYRGTDVPTRPMQYRASPTGRIPSPTNEPARLQTALAELVPTAKAVISARLNYSLSRNSPSWDTPIRDSDPIVIAAKKKLDEASAAHAREVGRRAEVFPVLYRIPLEDTETAAQANEEELGKIIFNALKQTFDANQTTQVRINGWQEQIPQLIARHDSRPDEMFAMILVSHEHTRKESIWNYPNYVQRALERLSPDTATVTYTATRRVMSKPHPRWAWILPAFGQMAGELTLMHVAGIVESKAKAVSKPLTFSLKVSVLGRAVPIVNWALAGWHIVSAVKEYGEAKADYWCTLDPKYALSAEEPSLAGLAFDIASEAVFAFIP